MEEGVEDCEEACAANRLGEAVAAAGPISGAEGDCTTLETKLVLAVSAKVLKLATPSAPVDLKLAVNSVEPVASVTSSSEPVAPVTSSSEPVAPAR